MRNPLGLCFAVLAAALLAAPMASLASQETAVVSAAPTPFPTATPTSQPVRTPLASPPTDAPEVRALWVDAFHEGFKTRRQVDELIDYARSANFNALFVQVRRRGDAYYLRSFEPRTEDASLTGFDALQYLIERAHQEPERIQVHAWLATLAIWSGHNEPPLSPEHVFNRYGLTEDPAQTWLQLRDDGESFAGEGAAGTYYLDPGNPGAARYTADTYLNVVRNYDVDGVHLDHVRYFEGAGDRRWGYNPTSVARFNTRFGREAGSTPDPDDPAWTAWRRDQVTALVRRLYLEVKALRPEVVVSAAVIAWGSGPTGPQGWERSAPYGTVFQDWRYWVEEGIVDYVMPMNYYRESTVQAGWLDNWMQWQQANRGKRGVVLGLGSYLNTPEETAAQIVRGRALMPLGVGLYSYAVPSSEGSGAAERQKLREQVQELFPRWASPPELPWLTRAVTGNLAVETGREGAVVKLTGPMNAELVADGTGLAGRLDLPPGRYRVSVGAALIDVDVAPERTTLVRIAD